MARRLILLAVVALAGCAEADAPTLATGSVEAALPPLIWPADPSRVTEVACPGVDAEVIAQAVICTADLDGDQVTIDAAVDEEGGVTASVVEPLFSLGDAGDQLAARLAADLGLAAPAVDCERAVVVARAGTEVACTATQAGLPIAFTFRLLDADGRWTVEVSG